MASKKYYHDIELNGEIIDSAGNAGSAGQVLTSDGTGQNLWQNGSATTSVYEVYQTGTTALIATALPVGFDTERFANPDYSLAASIVTVNYDGVVSINYSCSANVTNNSRSIVQWDVYINGSIVAGSRSFSYHRTTAAGEDTASKEILFNVSSGDQIEVRANVLAGAATTKITVAGASNLVLKRMS